MFEIAIVLLLLLSGSQRIGFVLFASSFLSPSWQFSVSNYSHRRVKNEYQSTFHSRSNLYTIIKHGPTVANDFIQFEEEWWGVQPLLIKGAFDPNEVRDEGGWPLLEDTIDLACDEEAESRLITYSKNDGFVIELGPFEEEDVRELIADKSDDSFAWTLLVNDVDRFYPAISDWIDRTFSFIPNWRKDDGQISIASERGGIGLHVDNYDVFLVQTAGIREWKIGTSLISVEEEFSFLIPGLDVRVLDLEEIVKHRKDFELESFTLEAGDVLYLPPRIPHWGTALSNDCATFSVGCRAPSGADLIARVAESIGKSVRGSAVRRYEDSDLLSGHGSNADINKGEITEKAKTKVKSLIRDAVEDLLCDNNRFDEWLGCILTEPKRFRHDYPIPLEASDEDESPESIVNDFLEEKCLFHHAEGLTFAYSRSSPRSRLFANGECLEVDSSVLVDVIANNKSFSANDLGENVSNQETTSVLQKLIQKGLLYYSDE